jgi:hypothetical protein
MVRILRRLPTIAIVLSVAIAFPLGVIASHQFTDVPTSNTFHDDIDAIADVGVTTGCAVGKYCPKDFVTREQMAAFLNRLGALGPGKTPVVNADKLDGLTSSQLARSDQTQHYSCAGPNMDPHQSTTTYTSTSSYRYLDLTSDFLSCAVHLPDGATVSSFTADVYDVYGEPGYHTTCGLIRVQSDETTGTLANTPGSGANPGYTTLVDATISTPVIDNAAYAYSAHCYLPGLVGNQIRVVKVTVTYTGAP